MMPIKLQGGEHGLLLKSDSERAVLLATVPAPPGTPLELALNNGERVLLKVRSCKRRSGTLEDVALEWEVEGRWVSLSRQQRALLARLPP